MTLQKISRPKTLAAALESVLAPAQLTAVREMILSENPGRAAPRPKDILYWMRVNMPIATQQIEDLLAGRDGGGAELLAP